MARINEKNEILVSDIEDLVRTTNNIEFSRRQGGWIKTITSIDKSKTDGYSLLGEFINYPSWIAIGTLLLDCSISGSRKNNVKAYHLVKLKEDETLDLLQAIPPASHEENKSWQLICGIK